MSSEPASFGVTDGHTIYGDYYKAICNIGGDEKEIVVSVIDPEKFFEEEDGKIETIEPLLGRGVLDEYDVLFKGKDKKLMLFHPE